MLEPWEPFLLLGSSSKQQSDRLFLRLCNNVESCLNIFRIAGRILLWLVLPWGKSDNAKNRKKYSVIYSTFL